MDLQNVIPAQVELSGTIRSQDEGTHAKLIEELERALAIARALGGNDCLRIDPGYPAAHDTPELVHIAASDLIGPENLQPPRSGMGRRGF